MSRVTRVKASCHVCERIVAHIGTSHIGTSRVTYVKASGDIFAKIVAHT